jgi:predicted acylesterase/phospholipase RssA
MTVHNRAAQLVASIFLIFFTVACASNIPRLDDAPPNTYAAPAGYHGIRYWGDAELKKLDEAIAIRRTQIAEASKTDARLSNTHADYLAISGGGSDGAFGAGLLVGWSQVGTRPEFEVVTGISTGALSAPFAFLGSEYDPQLKAIYTTISTKDILQSNGPVGALFGSSLTDNAPLKKLVAKYVTANLLNKIAAENSRGRRLFVGTTNLDAQRPVVWDMTAIASSDNPTKLQLFRDVLVASAAIPGIFPPQIIRVTSDGKAYDELHVDGGTTNQVFLMPAENSLKTVDKQLKFKRTRSVYVLMNGSFLPQHAKVKTATMAIATRSIDTLIKNQGIGDVYRMYTQALRDDVDFNVASIPADFTETSKDVFDKAYMNDLYKRGYKLATAGAAWQKTPPGYVN